MLIIGILAPQHSIPVLKLLKMILSESGKKYAVLKSDNMLSEHINALRETNIELVIIDINEKISGDIFLDVLICDNTANELDTTDYLIEKNITPESVIVYNCDVDFLDFKCRADKISYGLSAKADVTASSLDRHENGLEFVYCVQNTISTLFGKVIEMCEVSIKFADINANIYHALAAVTCCAVCEVE